MADGFFTRQTFQKYKFFKIPRMLFTNERLKKMLTPGEREVYAVYLDRISLSQQTATDTGGQRFEDDKGHLYLIYEQAELAHFLGTARPTISRYNENLKKAGLIHVEPQGKGKPNKIYVRDYAWVIENYPEDFKTLKEQGGGEGESRVTKSDARVTNCDAGRVTICDSSYTDSIYTDKSSSTEPEKATTTSPAKKDLDQEDYSLGEVLLNLGCANDRVALELVTEYPRDKILEAIDAFTAKFPGTHNEHRAKSFGLLIKMLKEGVYSPPDKARKKDKPDPPPARQKTYKGISYETEEELQALKQRENEINDPDYDPLKSEGYRRAMEERKRLGL